MKNINIPTIQPQEKKEKNLFEEYGLTLEDVVNPKKSREFFNRIWYDMQANRIMNPGHPRWREFADKLRDICFREGENEKKDSKNSTDQFSETKKILGEMFEEGEINLQKTIQYFLMTGGHSDSQIIFNVDHRTEEEAYGDED